MAYFTKSDWPEEFLEQLQGNCSTEQLEETASAWSLFDQRPFEELLFDDSLDDTLVEYMVLTIEYRPMRVFRGFAPGALAAGRVSKQEYDTFLAAEYSADQLKVLTEHILENAGQNPAEQEEFLQLPEELQHVALYAHERFKAFEMETKPLTFTYRVAIEPPDDSSA